MHMPLEGLQAFKLIFMIYLLLDTRSTKIQLKGEVRNAQADMHCASRDQSPD